MKAADGPVGFVSSAFLQMVARSASAPKLPPKADVGRPLDAGPRDVNGSHHHATQGWDPGAIVLPAVSTDKAGMVGAIQDSAADDAEGQAFVDDARSRKKGCTAYNLGGQGPSYFDCSGLTKVVMEKKGARQWAPQGAGAQAKMGRGVKYEDMKPGDVVIFKKHKGSIEHCGFFVGWAKNKDGSARYMDRPVRDAQGDKIKGPDGKPVMEKVRVPILLHASPRNQNPGNALPKKTGIVEEAYTEPTLDFHSARRIRKSDPNDAVSRPIKR